MPGCLVHALTHKANNQHGMVLVMTLVCLAILTVLGATAVTITSTDLLLGGAFKSGRIAFYNAEAGIHYAVSQIMLAAAKDTPLLSDSQPLERLFASQVFHQPPPAGFAFEIDPQRSAQMTNRKYVLRVIGRPTLTSPIRRVIEVVVERRAALRYGLFATARLDLPATGNVFSYDSRLDDLPLPQASTGKVNIGSNGEVTTKANHLDLGLDGIITLGMDPDGTRATFTYRDPAPDVPPPPVILPQGQDQEIELVAADAIAADPLDVNTLVEDAAQHFRFDNNNADIGALEGDRLTSSAHLRGGDYYLDELNLETGEHLLLDARKADVNIYAKAISLSGAALLRIHTGDGQAGKVTIYLDGPASFGTSEPLREPKPVVLIEGDTTSFRVFSRSSEPIDFYHHGDFKGLVYAPYAPIRVGNATGKGYGLMWGQTVDLRNHGLPYAFFIDTATTELFLSNEIDILSWKEIQE
jgi:hypothetical protein